MARIQIWSITINLFILCNTVYGFLIDLSAEESLNDTTTGATTTTNSSAATLDYRTRLLWADSAFSYIKSLNCSEVYFTSHRECNHLLIVRKRNVVVYVAQPPNPVEGDFVAILPDGGLSRAGRHHGVVALDPHPDANFGHLVIVFFIKKVSNQEACERHRGRYLGNGDCMKLALKHRCKNAIERRRRDHEDSGTMSSRFMRKMVRRCEINFLPRIYKYTRRSPPIIEGISQGYDQALLCREDLVDYSLCPTLRPANETTQLVCNPIRDNTRRCETSHDMVGTRCRMFESCDNAVLISGGWNQQTSITRHSENIVNMYQLLRRNGFQQPSIKIFFANGMHRGIQEESGAESVNTEIFPAAMKTAMRFHIRRLCETPHCVDTLVLYLNSPSKTDGTMLLWDLNKDGKADEDEQYNVTELLRDIRRCSARSVQIIADQSFSGEITKAIRKSSDHQNVFAFASGKENEYSYESTFTDHWVRRDHSHVCTEDVFHQIKSAMVLSNPDIGLKAHRTNEGPGPLTLFGAPCNVDPPFTSSELSLWYRGCQNVPTEVWLRTFFSPSMNSGSNSNNNPSSSSRDNSNNVISGQSANSHTADEDGSGDGSTAEEIVVNSIPTT